MTTAVPGSITILPSDPKGGANRNVQSTPSKPPTQTIKGNVAAAVARYTEADVDALFDD